MKIENVHFDVNTKCCANDTKFNYVIFLLFFFCNFLYSHLIYDGMCEGTFMNIKKKDEFKSF